MTHADIIKKLGGPTALARALGIAKKTPLHWGYRGIPAVYWHRIAALPAAVQHRITADLLHDTKTSTKGCGNLGSGPVQAAA